MYKILIPYSSSKGCSALYYNDEEILMIDCGGTCDHLEQILNIYDIDIKKIKVLLSHEHTDHVSGLNFAKKYNLPIYATPATIAAVANNLKAYNFRTIQKNKWIDIGNWKIFPFSTVHNAVDPVGFLIENEIGERGIHVTDTQEVNIKTTKNFVFYAVERNHDINLIKDDVSSIGSNFHLSNDKHDAYIAKNNINNGLVIPLHGSTRHNNNLIQFPYFNKVGIDKQNVPF